MNSSIITQETANILESIDLSFFKEKGLSNEQISVITMLPIECIQKYFHQKDQLRLQSGIF